MNMNDILAMIHWDWIVTLVAALLIKEVFQVVISFLSPWLYPNMRNALVTASYSTGSPMAVRAVQTITEELNEEPAGIQPSGN